MISQDRGTPAKDKGQSGKGDTESGKGDTGSRKGDTVNYLLDKSRCPLFLSATKVLASLE
jgi:hypothetical protein